MQPHYIPLAAIVIIVLTVIVNLVRTRRKSATPKDPPPVMTSEQLDKILEHVEKPAGQIGNLMIGFWLSLIFLAGCGAIVWVLIALGKQLVGL